jgi:hypothetical protein
VAVGGVFFLRMVLMPSAQASLSDEAHQALQTKVIGRWKMVVHTCVALLLVTGIYNYVRSAIVLHKGQALYHGLAGVKMMLALLVFTLAIGLTGRSAAFAKFREKRSTWLAITLALATVIVLISGVLRNIPTVRETDQGPKTAASTASTFGTSSSQSADASLLTLQKSPSSMTPVTPGRPKS